MNEPLDRSVLEEIASRFGLPAAALRRIARSQNDVYECVTETDRSILRVSHGRGRTANEIEAELDWVERLADRGVRACRPRRSAAGRRVESLTRPEGEYLAASFDYAPGRLIERADIDLALYQRFGELTARLHADSFDALPRSPRTPHRAKWHDSRLLTTDVNRFTAASDERFRTAVRSLVADLKPRVSDRLGLIHGDISFSNVHLDGDRLWIFDFDNCEYGPVVQDLATFLYDSIYCDLLHRVPDAELSARIQERWEAYLSGYRTVRAIGPIDADLLRGFVVLREATIYVHYCRIFDMATVKESWRRGMEEMRANVEERRPAFELVDWRG